MKTFGEILKQLREDKGLFLREVATSINVDMALISKYESGNRRPTREQVSLFAKLYNVDERELLIQFLSDKYVYEMQNEECGLEVFKIAEKKYLYLKKRQVTV